MVMPFDSLHFKTFELFFFQEWNLSLQQFTLTHTKSILFQKENQPKLVSKWKRRSNPWPFPPSDISSFWSDQLYQLLSKLHVHIWAWLFGHVLTPPSSWGNTISIDKHLDTMPSQGLREQWIARHRQGNYCHVVYRRMWLYSSWFSKRGRFFP